jgi:plasmid maintenance system antidote protein VapI
LLGQTGALRRLLEHALFDVDPRFWLNLQTAYNISLAENQNRYSTAKPRKMLTAA